MNNPPSFSKLDVDRILRRAAEIEGSDDAGPVTVDEIRSIAREAGFGANAIERAIGEARQAAVNVRRPPMRRSGILIVRISVVRTIPIEITSEQLMRAVRLFQPYRDGPAQVRLGEDQVRWRDRRGLRFTVGSYDGETEIRVFVWRPIVRRGRWIGWATSAADRLAELVLLVAAQSADEGEDSNALAPASSPAASRGRATGSGAIMSPTREPLLGE